MKKMLILLILLTAVNFSYAQSPAKKIRLKGNTQTKLEVKENSKQSFRIGYVFSEIDKVFEQKAEDGKSYTVLSLKGFANNGKVGEPMLPQKTELIQIPTGKKWRLEIKKIKYQDVKLAGEGFIQPIMPMQMPVSKSAKDVPPFVRQEKVYSSSVFNEVPWAEVQCIGEMRGVRLAKLIVSPIRYNPAKNMIRICRELEIEVFFEEDVDTKQSLPAESHYNSVFKKAIQANLSNPSEDLQKAMYHAQEILRYQIIADPMFEENLKPFVEWKKIQGFDVRVAYTSEEKVGKTPMKIKAYLKGLYDNADADNPAPTYILLVGDVEQIPAFPSALPEPNKDLPYPRNHVSDLYYAEYTNDYLPDAFYGRFSAETPEQLKPQIDKTIAMEQASVANAHFLDTSLLLGGYDTRWGKIRINPHLEYIQNNYMQDTSGIVARPYLFPNSIVHKEDIMNDLSRGVNLLCYTGHGVESGFAEPAIRVEDVERMSNEGKYFFVFSNCCLTGKFDDHICFGEALLRADKAGAVGFIGASNVTYFDEDFYWAVGYNNMIYDDNPVYTYENTGHSAFDRLFHTHGEAYQDWASTAFEALLAGNMQVELANSLVKNYYWEVYHVFGDPSFAFYKNRPDVLRIDAPSYIPEGCTELSLQTEPYAKISFSYKNELYGSAQADSTGKLQVFMKPLVNMDSVLLYASSVFKAPYIHKIAVSSPEEAYLYIDNLAYQKENAGQSDSLFYSGNYTHSFQIRNSGSKAAENIKLKVLLNDPYVSSIEDLSLTESIAAGASLSKEGILLFQIDPNVPYGHVLNYELQVFTGETLVSTLRVKKQIYSPKIQISSIRIKDPSGDGVLDRGERANIEIRIKNEGIKADDLKLRLSSDVDFIRFPENEKTLLPLSQGEEQVVEIEVEAEDWASRYKILNIKFEFLSLQRVMQHEYQTYVSRSREDFETGGFSFLPWENENKEWIMSEDVVYQGLYSASNKTIADKDSAELKIRLNAAMDDSISFMYKTSTEFYQDDFGDFLYFYIDDSLKAKWAGNRDWSRVVYPITQGEHTYRWVYRKDEMTKEGKDKVWLDDICFPVGAIEASIADDQAILSDHEMMYISYENGYPNLHFNIDSEMRGTLYVYDLLGRLQSVKYGLLITKGKSNFDLLQGKLKKGTYICKFESHNLAQRGLVTKFVKIQ